jgi:adenosylcobinamide-phosphate synthase
MTFFSVLFSLILEQYAPVGEKHWSQRLMRYWIDLVPNYCDTGEQTSAKIAIAVLILPPVLIVLMVHLWLIYHFPLLAFAWNILIVYSFMGFRQFSHSYTAIKVALQERRLDEARAILAKWCGTKLNTETLSESDIVRYTLERAILDVHSHVFGVFFAFLLPIGPAGVVLYRLTLIAEERWKYGVVSPNLMVMVQKFRYIVDWLPTRLTAIGFTIVGNFEQAAYAWRYHQKKWDTQSKAILIGTGGGALGVQLGEPLAQLSSTEAMRLADLGEIPVQEIGALPRPIHLASGASLVWRAIVLWMILLGMLTLSVWFNPG